LYWGGILGLWPTYVPVGPVRDRGDGCGGREVW